MEKEVNSMQIKFRIKNRTVSNIRAKLFMHSENWNTRDFFYLTEISANTKWVLLLSNIGKLRLFGAQLQNNATWYSSFFRNENDIFSILRPKRRMRKNISNDSSHFVWISIGIGFIFRYRK